MAAKGTEVLLMHRTELLYVGHVIKEGDIEVKTAVTIFVEHLLIDFVKRLERCKENMKRWTLMSMLRLLTTMTPTT